MMGKLQRATHARAAALSTSVLAICTGACFDLEFSAGDTSTASNSSAGGGSSTGSPSSSDSSSADSSSSDSSSSITSPASNSASTASAGGGGQGGDGSGGQGAGEGTGGQGDGGAGGQGGGGACPTIECNSVCVAVDDPLNCGGCSITCELDSDACTGGTCSCSDVSPLSRSPQANALAVATTAPIEIDFGCTIDATTITAGNVQVTGSLSGPINGALSLPTVGSIRFVPAAAYRWGEQISFSLTSRVTTQGGTSLAGTYGFFVETAVGPQSSVLDTYAKLGAVDSSEVALGDLDGDGDLDAFAAKSGADAVWRGHGDGTFTSSGQGIGSSPSSWVALGDLDGDGDVDAFVAKSGGGNEVWRNDGAAVFSDTGQVLGAAGSTGVALGDLDGDGDLDAYVVRASGPGSVWLNNGSGAFTDSGQAMGSAGDSGLAVALADADGDGDLDAVVANLAGPSRVWRNDGAGTFTDAGQSLGASDGRGVALGDLDGDGDVDAVIAGLSSFTVWLGDGSGTFTDGGVSVGTTRGVALGDIDGDGDLDVVTDNGGMWHNDGNGAFVDTMQALPSNRVALGDLDGDGDLDVFMSSSDTDSVALTVPDSASCSVLHDEAPALRSGQQPLVAPGPTTFFAYCDMEADGGGWTLLVNDGPAFDRTGTGDPASACFKSTCTGFAYGVLPLGSDLRLDASDAGIVGETYDVRTVITGIDAAFAGATLRARLTDTATRYYVEADDNGNVENQFLGGSCGTLPYPDYRDIICGTNVLAVNDPSICAPMPNLVFGTEFDRTTEFFNCAGWPDQTNYGGTNYWPDYLRIWTR